MSNTDNVEKIVKYPNRAVISSNGKFHFMMIVAISREMMRFFFRFKRNGFYLKKTKGSTMQK